MPRCTNTADLRGTTTMRRLAANPPQPPPPPPPPPAHHSAQPCAPSACRPQGPRKGGVNEKVEAARERKAGAKKAAADKAEKAREDAYWCASTQPAAGCGGACCEPWPARARAPADACTAARTLAIAVPVAGVLQTTRTLHAPCRDAHANPKAKRDTKKEEQARGQAPEGMGWCWCRAAGVGRGAAGVARVSAAPAACPAGATCAACRLALLPRLWLCAGAAARGGGPQEGGSQEAGCGGGGGPGGGGQEEGCQAGAQGACAAATSRSACDLLLPEARGQPHRSRRLWPAPASQAVDCPLLLHIDLPLLLRPHSIPLLRLRPRPHTQVTAAQLAAQREREQREMAAQAEAQAAGLKRMVSEDDYAAAIEVQNRNRWVGCGGWVGFAAWVRVGGWVGGTAGQQEA